MSFEGRVQLGALNIWMGEMMLVSVGLHYSGWRSGSLTLPVKRISARANMEATTYMILLLMRFISWTEPIKEYA